MALSERVIDGVPSSAKAGKAVRTVRVWKSSRYKAGYPGYCELHSNGHKWWIVCRAYADEAASELSTSVTAAN